ncbi:hypothetical protein WN51_00737 [Melipona quadrifasciata]|uniref:Serpin domain-containing protein n=1 Tax=Melipona quadrifasciata TaxID=166423 RepID=A0A0M8ZXA0_9HYME|nr:hypothetical protein WN51_00737 [Melipona quadrifasciata]
MVLQGKYLNYSLAIYTVSGSGIHPTIVPMAFIVDHPFILNIVIRDLNVLIFSGHIVEP